MENFDYSVVPRGFGHCMASCPQAVTCLRHIAYEHLPADKAFVWMLVPHMAGQAQGKCKYYCPNTKVRYAKGFARIIDEWEERTITPRARETGCSRPPNRSRYVPYSARWEHRTRTVSTATLTALSGNKRRAPCPHSMFPRVSAGGTPFPL